MTSAPTRAAATAAAVPAGPPPTTSTSVSANTGVSRAASRILLAGRGRRSPLAPPKIARRPRRPSAPKISSPMSSATMFFDVSSVIRSSEPLGPLPGHGAQVELAQAAIDPQPGHEFADEGAVRGPLGGEPRGLVGAPHGGVGGGLDLVALVAILQALVAGEVDHPAAFGAQFLADREHHRVAEPAAGEQHGFA